MFRKISIQRRSSENILFLDLDGIFADFSRGVYLEFGEDISHIPHSELWKGLSEARDTFYANLPIIPGSRAFWNFCSKFRPKPVILTKVPHEFPNEASRQKKQWVTRNLSSNAPVITCIGDKAEYIRNEGDTLVDDQDKNRPSWEARGGNFILHNSIPDTIKELRQLGWK